MKQRDSYSLIIGDTDPARLIAIGVALGIVLGIVIKVFFTPVVETAHAEIIEEVVPVEVMIEIETTEEYIIKRIRETFPEEPNTAVAVAKCESGLRVEIQSHHMLNGSREQSFGLFQVFAPVWHDDAIRLGHTEYRTNVEDNLLMARYIYEQAGNSWQPWSCWSKKMI